MSENFGMMGGAFFVSRSELLEWVRDTIRVRRAVRGVGGAAQGGALRVGGGVLPADGLDLRELSDEQGQLGRHPFLCCYLLYSKTECTIIAMVP